ncbi:MAG: hypothetical protein HC847_29650 [Hydrococcus sp. RU_2_2]|nr:hypothetical protein [Hydrococcus sp. RU_2_2]
MAASRGWIRQRSFLRDAYNKEVKRWFRELGDIDDPNFTTSRGAVMAACLIAAGDSQNMTLIKMETFRRVVQRTHLRPHVYGMPTTELQVIRRFKPQIQLHFMQDSKRNYEISKSPAIGQISFRLMNETSESITRGEVERLANAIKREFMALNGYVWSKGRLMATYTDREKGYQLQLLCYNESEAKTLIGKVLGIQNHPFERKRLSLNKNDDELSAYPGIPQTVTILGKSEREPKRRPVADVRFTHAELHLYGRGEPVILCDRTHRYVNPVVTAA